MSEGKKHHHRGRKKKKGSIVSTLILIVALCVFIFSGYQLYKMYSEYRKGNAEYDKVQDIAVKQNKEKADEFTVDFEALQKLNPDAAAWIRFEEPSEINYPVVKGKDNKEYLTRTFEKNDNKLGALFIDEDNSKEFTDMNTFIYGHNMKNGSMFAKLMKYKEEQYYKDNPYFYIYTPDGKEAKYQIYSAGVVKDTSDNYKKTYAAEGEFQAYLDTLKSSSLYDTGTQVDVNSKLVSLSTCTNVKDDERFLVHGVKISEK